MHHTKNVCENNVLCSADRFEKEMFDNVMPVHFVQSMRG